MTRKLIDVPHTVFVKDFVVQKFLTSDDVLLYGKERFVKIFKYLTKYRFENNFVKLSK